MQTVPFLIPGSGESVNHSGLSEKLTHDFMNELTPLKGYFDLSDEGYTELDLVDVLATIKPLQTYRERLSQDDRFQGHLEALGIDEQTLITMFDPFIELINRTYFIDGIFVHKNLRREIFDSCRHSIDAIVKGKTGCFDVVKASVNKILPLLDYPRTGIPAFINEGAQDIPAAA